MKKRMIVLTVLICSFGLLVLLNCFDGGLLVGSGRSPVERLVVQSIKIQYKCFGDDTDELSRIFTSDFTRQIKTKPGFYKKKLLLRVDKDALNSLTASTQNQLSTEVRVTDSSGTYYQEITLTKDSNGEYKISNIEFDI